MKLSCLPVSWFADIIAGQKTVAEWIRTAASLGLDGADLSVALLADVQPDTLRAIRREAEAAGIRIVMFCTYSDFTLPDADVRAQQMQQIRRHIEAAGELGASLVRMTAGQAFPGVTRAQGIRQVVEGLRECVPWAQQAGVTLAYENHTKGYPWTYSDFSQPKDIFLEIVRQTEGTAVGINFDTANPLVDNVDVLALLKPLTKRVVSIHANDLRQAGQFQPVILGTGVSPIPQVFAHMKASGFDGWVCIEEASRQGLAGMQQAVAFARRAWETA